MGILKFDGPNHDEFSLGCEWFRVIRICANRKCKKPTKTDNAELKKCKACKGALRVQKQKDVEENDEEVLSPNPKKVKSILKKPEKGKEVSTLEPKKVHFPSHLHRRLANYGSPRADGLRPREGVSRHDDTSAQRRIRRLLASEAAGYAC